MGYVIYLRKSRADLEAEAHGEGETLARHRQALAATASGMGITVSQVYEEIESGETIAARPVMRRLLREIEVGRWQGVLVMEVERLARGDTIDQGVVARAFRLSGTKIITPLKIYDPQDEFDEEYFEFGLFMSRREYKTINRRLQRGRAASVREGKYIGSRPPYGYKRKKLENDKGYTLEPQEEQAEAVRSAFRWFTEGYAGESLCATEIAQRLNEMGIPSASGGTWLPATVRALLRNPVYIGKVRWGYRSQRKMVDEGRIIVSRPQAPSKEWLLADGLHPALITEGQFHKAQTRFAELPEKFRPATLKNPFAGVVTCALCGKGLTRRPQKQGSPLLICTTPHCKNVGVSIELMENAVQEALDYWFHEWRLPRPSISAFSANSGAHKAVQLHRQSLLRQKGRIFDFLENGFYNPEQFQERLRKIDDKLAKCSCADAPAKPETEIKTPWQAGQIQTISELYQALPNAKEKNRMLRVLFEKIEYLKEKAGRWHTTPSTYLLTLYPKLPPNPKHY